jgi:hypothetical protein
MRLICSLPPDGGVRAHFHINIDSIKGIRKRNYTAQIPKNVEIENLRGEEESVLQGSGFTRSHQVTSCSPTTRKL